MENHTIFNKYKQLSIEIYEWCKKHDLWGDNTIYFNGIAWSNSETWAGVKGKKITDDLYEYEDKDPRDYFEGGSSVLSMSFEGPLNYVLNGYVDGWIKLSDEFYKLFDKHSLMFEMYNSWNGNAYEI